MDKIKIKPFFYLILSRDGKGKLRFEVYDMAEERGSLLKDISTENGLLKYREEDKDLREYVKPLIDDIADAYSRMGRIVISYKGDIAHSEAVKETVRAYNEKHKDETDKPVFTFIEMKNNFSLEELVKKINFHFERAVQLTNSFDLDFSKIEYDPIFTNDEYENDSSVNKTNRKVSDNAVRNDENSENGSNSGIVKKTKDILESIPIISFEIKEAVDQKEFLGYIKDRKRPISIAVSRLNDLMTAYTSIIEVYRKYLGCTKENIIENVGNEIFEKIRQKYDDVLISSIDVLYDQYLVKNPPDYYPKIHEWDYISYNLLRGELSKVISCRLNKVSVFQEEAIAELKNFNNIVYGIIRSVIKSYFPSSEAFDPKDYSSFCSFVSRDMESSAEKILNFKMNETDVAYRIISAKTIYGRNENEFTISRYNGEFVVDSISELLNKTDKYIRTLYSRNEIKNNLKDLMNRRIESFRENSIPMIIDLLPDIDESINITDEKIEYLMNERQKINEIYSDLSASISEINSIIDTYNKMLSSEEA